MIRIEGRIDPCAVRCIWDDVHDVVTTQQLYDSAGKPGVLLTLPEELQLRRLEAFTFNPHNFADRNVGHHDWQAKGKVGMRRSKNLLREELFADLRRAREQDDFKKLCINEMLREARKLK